MKNKFIKTLNLNLAITLAICVMNFLVNKSFVKYMGISDLGLMKLFTQLVAYLNLAELGIGTASIYAFYNPIVTKNVEKINTIFFTLNSLYKKVFYAILVMGALSSFLLPFIIKEYYFDYKIYSYWILYIVNVALSYLSAKYVILFTANQEYIYIRKIQGIGKILFQSLQILVLIYLQSFIIFILIMIFENLFVYFFYKIHFKKDYIYIKNTSEREKNIFKDIKNIFWHKIATVVVLNTDYILISRYISLKFVGIYSNYFMIYQMIITLVGILTSVLAPKVGQFVVKKKNEVIYSYWKELNSIYLFLGCIILLGTYKLANSFIFLWLGKEFLLSELTVLLIFINLFIQIIRQMTEVFKASLGFFDDIYSPILEMVINFFLSIYLVKKIGLNGIIIGTIFSNIIIILVLKPILVFKRCFKKNIKEYIEYFFIQMVYVSFSLTISNYFINLLIKIENIANWYIWIKTSFLVTIISASISGIIFLLNSDFRGIIKKINKKLSE